MEKQLSPQRSRGGYLEALLNSCPVAILAIDGEGTITFANKAACELVECVMQELIGSSIVTVYESLEAAKETNRKLHMSGGLVHDHESKVKTKVGKLVPVRISAAHMRDSSGNYIGAVGFFEKYRPWSGAEAEVKAYAEELEAKLEEWKDLGAPVFQLYPGLSAVVVVGRLDIDRFMRVTSSLLSHVESMRSRVVLIDLSAALVEDVTSIASELLKTIRTIRLLGAQCVLAGIQSSLAQAIEPLVPDVESVKSFCCTDVSIEAALNIIGFGIHKKD